VSAHSHTQRTIRGANWNMLRVLLQTVVSLGSTVVVARILTPEDFGLLATAMIFVGFAEIISNVGMGSAVIQRKDLDEAKIRTATTLSVLLGLLLLAAIWLISEPVALFFGDPRIGPVVRVLGFAVLLSALSTVSRGLIMRRMDFRKLFFIDSVGHVVGYVGVVITLALLGYGVWSMVLGTLATNFLGALFSFLCEPFRMTFKPQREDLRTLISYGGGMSLSSIVGYFARKSDYVVIGKFLDQAMLGLYNRAYHLINLPLRKITGTLGSVMFASYAEVQDNLPRLRQVYLRVLSVTSVITFPVFIGMLVCGEYIITGLYGVRWAAAVPVFQVLCLMGLVRLVLVLTGPVVQAMGYVHAEMRRQLVFFVILVGGAVMAAQYGITEVAISVVVATVWLYLSMARLAIRLLEASWGAFLRAQLPGYYLGLLVGVVDFIVIQSVSPLIDSAEIMLLVLMVTSGLAYVTGFLYLPARLMGDAPRWVLEKYQRRLPERLKRRLGITVAAAAENKD
jgi:O-antigen/teichoic acid export membrane protein